MTRWSEDQIEARIALGLDCDEVAIAPVSSESCICRDGAEPNEEGLRFLSPSCPIHGLRSQWHESRVGRQDARTVGSVHAGHRSNG